MSYFDCFISADLRTILLPEYSKDLSIDIDGWQECYAYDNRIKKYRKQKFRRENYKKACDLNFESMERFNARNRAKKV